MQYWLDWIKSYHDQAINYGLDHITRAAQQLGLQHFDSTVITVAGTNGKGSCVATMEAVLLAHGYTVAAYTSPHMFNFNERIRINGNPVSNETIAAAMQIVQDFILAHTDLNLSLFEFVTLAALIIFRDHKADFILLEVGLGGRLDAVNVVANDIAIITSIALDHCKYLGDTIEQIGFEKAGIIQAQSQAIYAAATPPQTVMHFCNQQKVKLKRFGLDYNFATHGLTWDLDCVQQQFHNLPHINFPISNAAAAIYALSLSAKIKLQDNYVRAALRRIKLPGRFQVAACKHHEIIFDVAHNPAAVSWLVEQISARSQFETTVVILGVAASKDVRAMLLTWNIIVDTWYVCEPASMRRATSTALLTEHIIATQQGKTCVVKNAVEGLNIALSKARSTRIIVFGSFHTVAEALLGLNRILENDRVYLG